MSRSFIRPGFDIYYVMTLTASKGIISVCAAFTQSKNDWGSERKRKREREREREREKERERE